MKLKFRTKLVVICTAALLMQGIAVGFFSWSHAEGLILAGKRKDMADMVNLVDINLNVTVRYISGLIDSAGESQALRQLVGQEGGNGIDAGAYFQSLQAAVSAISNVVVADGQGVVFSMSGPQADHSAVVGSPAYSMALRRPARAHWPGVFESLDPTLDPVIPVSKAILSGEGAPLGVMIFELDPAAFRVSLLNNHNAFQNQYTFIVDGRGEVVCSNKAVDPAWVDLVAERFASGSRRFQTELGGREYYVVGQYNGLTGWVTFSAIAIDNIVYQSRQLRQLIVSSVAISTLLTVLLIAVLSYAITHPIKKLSDAMELVMLGNLDVRVKPRRRDEVGELTSSFNFMLDRINLLISEVYLKKIAQKDARLKALEAEINPHFLYNTLDCIHWMLEEKGEEEVSRIIVSLGGLLRYSIDKNNPVVCLSDEIAYIQNYLLIQKMRLEDHLGYQIDIPQSMYGQKVPKLILQPLVENAILHGVEPQGGGGFVKISAKALAGMLVVEVADNGPGMDKDTLNRLRSSLACEKSDTDHIGVRNVDQRLRLRYGRGYRLKIDSDLGIGTKVAVTIPMEG